MIITCCCCTFRRPRHVGWLIHQFLRQSHPDKRLFILADDGCFGYIENRDDHWKIVPTDFRYRTLGSKRNASIRMACETWAETQSIALWDDDDTFLPWHMETMNAALENADWSLPSEVLYRNPDGTYRRHLTGPGKFFHAGMGFRVDALRRANPHVWFEPYDERLSGPEDQSLFRRLEASSATICDPITLTGKPPSYVYGCNDGLTHISAYLKPNDTGGDAYAICGQQPCEAAGLVIEPPPGVELQNPQIVGPALPRPF